MVKKLPSGGDPGSVPVLRRSPGEGNGHPLQYSCLENPVDRGAWQDTVHEVTKNQKRLSDFSLASHRRSRVKSLRFRSHITTGSQALSPVCLIVCLSAHLYREEYVPEMRGPPGKFSKSWQIPPMNILTWNPSLSSNNKI